MSRPKRTCTLPGCGLEHRGHGYCDKHMRRMQQHGTTDLIIPTKEERFWAKVNKSGPDGCWVWTASKNDLGYGQFQQHRAHRYSARLAGMDIEGKYVLHSCDNPPCVNPAHLRPGDAYDNMHDAMDRNRRAIGSELHVAKLDESKVYRIRLMLRDGVRQKDIADMYGLHQTTISYIARGLTWRHVEVAA